MSVSALIAEVPIETKSIADYERFGKELCDEIVGIAKSLQDRAIFHINSTEKGGGVAELLKSQVALEQGLGLTSRWLVIRPSAKFFGVTKKIHHLLQGAEGRLSADEEAMYAEESTQLARALTEHLKRQPAELLVVHDPQPLGAASGLSTEKVLRLHIDLCRPNPTAIDWLCQSVPAFNHVIISREDCTLFCTPPGMLTTIPPAIDPLIPKNNPLPLGAAQKIIQEHGIDSKRPLLTQISRFDQWKDPLGVIKAYRLAKRSIPDVQLALVGFFQADDDADSIEYFKLVQAEAGSDPDIHLFSNVEQLYETPNDVFINALQVGSDVVVQKSVREGFGLTATEAMWKGKAVVGGDAGGIRLQITSGENGILVHTVEETARAIIELISHPARRKKLGQAARQSVQEKFLMTRFVRDNLVVYRRLMRSSV